MSQKLTVGKIEQLSRSRTSPPQFEYSDYKLQLLFKLQEIFPVESGVGLASGLDLGLTIAKQYIDSLIAERDKLKKKAELPSVRAESLLEHRAKLFTRYRNLGYGFADSQVKASNDILYLLAYITCRAARKDKQK